MLRNGWHTVRACDRADSPRTPGREVAGVTWQELQGKESGATPAAHALCVWPARPENSVGSRRGRGMQRAPHLYGPGLGPGVRAGPGHPSTTVNRANEYLCVGGRREWDMARTMGMNLWGKKC